MVSVMLIVCNLSVFLSMCLLVLCVLCLTVLFVECVCYLCGCDECFLFESYGVVFGLCCFSVD